MYDSLPGLDDGVGCWRLVVVDRGVVFTVVAISPGDDCVVCAALRRRCVMGATRCCIGCCCCWRRSLSLCPTRLAALTWLTHNSGSGYYSSFGLCTPFAGRPAACGLFETSSWWSPSFSSAGCCHLKTMPYLVLLYYHMLRCSCVCLLYLSVPSSAIYCTFDGEGEDSTALATSNSRHPADLLTLG